ncbi:hypothetical protein J4212_02930 [Candidatus Woesearchaeota archaeon]|nr:hypothetical protein [Candidatus Woesearchaeota archaeon]
MLTFIVSIVLLLFTLAALLFFFSNVPIFINVAALAVIIVLILRDLKDEEQERHYAIGLMATAAFFIASGSPVFSRLLDRLAAGTLSYFTLGFLLVLLFAKISQLVHKKFFSRGGHGHH